AHDYHLNLSICKGERPEIIKNTPECYTDLMKLCWDSEPSKRPTLKILEQNISVWLECISLYNGMDINQSYIDLPIDLPFLKEFEEANKDLVQQKQANISVIQSHPQAYYK